MDYMIVIPQPRGQITLPKKLRDKYGVESGVPLKIVDTHEGILVTKLEASTSKKYVRKPKISRKQYIKSVRGMSEYIKNNGPLWTEEDDKRRVESLKLEKKRWKKLNW